MEPAVKVRDLVVRRGGRRVLDGVSLDIPPGQVTGLLGPSGSGKTTLLRAVVGVQVIASGSVTVLGRPAGDPALRRRLGYQTQAPSIYPDLTVAQNIGYFAALYGASQEQADRTLADVGLKAQADQLAGTLSGGQQSRASLGCALVGSPELVVLDEPTTGQDPLLRDELWAMFRRLAGEGAGLVVSSHVMDEANRCDRLVLIRQGVVIADDTPARLKERTGTDDLDEAFLRLVRTREAA